MKKYTITYRHKVVILADSPEYARNVFEDLDLGALNSNPDLEKHSFVEEVSFEDEDNNEIEI
jgi:hypothetical protein